MRATFFCIDGHTCGNPVRVVTGGSIPRLEGATMFERRQDFLAAIEHSRAFEAGDRAARHHPDRVAAGVAVNAEKGRTHGVGLARAAKTVTQRKWLCRYGCFAPE